MRRLLGGALALFSLHASEWPNYGNDPGGMRYSPLKQIHRGNVQRLKVAWTFHTKEYSPEMRNTRTNRVTAFEATPIVVDGVLYFSTPQNRVIALDAESGKELWVYDPQADAAGKRRTNQHRGVAYWPGRAGVPPRILYGNLEARLIALDARTGRPCPDFGNDGYVDLRKGVADNFPKGRYSITSPPTVYKDVVISGSAVQEGPSKGPAGDVRAYDAKTGNLVWQFHTVPRPGEFGHDSWAGDSWKDRSGVNAWSIMTVDAERGIVYLPIGSPAYDFYGGDRHGANLFGNSVVALDAATGKRIWHFQMVHHDVWDYDLPAHPTLVTAKGKPAVAQVTKMGFVFVLDRVTGKPVFPVEERAVPQSRTPGEASSRTQPFPVKPPPLSKLNVERDEITTLSAESRKFCMELFDSLEMRGIFTPWGPRMTLMMPGTLGGATWSGASFDPESNYLFVNANELGGVGLMKEQPEGSPMRYSRSSPWGAYARFADLDGYPCQQPPWGTLNAIDLNTGEIAWRVPLGFLESLESKGLTNTGAPSLGGTIATAGGLVFIAGTGDRRFRAFDVRTGKLLWEGKLPAGGHATPMTYQGRKNGRQYVVIAAGGGGYFSESVADALVAFSLPE
ncbi:MAG: pyrroloquinoline quinone-dependent dehydrogenase [Bryobacteraceae bacterium]